MTISLRSNIAALRTQRILGRTADQLSTTLARLSSGERINRASDDAGGLAISESLKSKAAVAAVAIRNSSDGISALTIADGALGGISDILGRMSELAEQAANGTLSSAQRTVLNREFRALGDEIYRISETKKFNGRELIIQRPGGDIGTSPFPDPSAIDRTGTTVTLVSYTEYDSNSITLQVGFTSSSDSRITTASINASLTGLGLGNYYLVNSEPVREYLDKNIRTQVEARASLTALTTAADLVASYRGQIGAVQSRLDVAVDSLSVSEENLLAANSRIRSADFAAESAELVRLSIAQNAGTAVLAQANQQPALALTLLRGS